MSNYIEGKVVVITGASSGLGEAIAQLLSAQGASVVLGARRANRIQSLADELSSRGRKARGLYCSRGRLVQRGQYGQGGIAESGAVCRPEGQT